MTKDEVLALKAEADRLQIIALDAVNTPGADWQAASADFMIAAEKFTAGFEQYAREMGAIE